MERLNCNGQVTIERTVDDVIFTNGMNERTRKDICTDQKSELWIALDLYRVLVRQVEICVVSMDTVDGAGDGYITAASVIQRQKDKCPPPVRSVSDGPADGYLTPLLVAQKSDEYLELKPQEQKKTKEIQQHEDKYPLPERSVSAWSYTSVAGDYSDRTNDGYITPVAVTQGHHDYLELKPEEKKKHHSYTERIESTQSYTFVTGKESETRIQEKSTSVQSKLEPLIPAEDLVRFESSFNGNFADLVKDLTALDLCDHLISLHVITIAELENISSKDTSRHQNRELLLLLCKKQVPKLKFKAALKDSGNGHLIEKFFPYQEHTSYSLSESKYKAARKDSGNRNLIQTFVQRETDAFNTSLTESKFKAAPQTSGNGHLIQKYYQNERSVLLQKRIEGNNTDLISSSLACTHVEADSDRTSLGYWCLCALQRRIKATTGPWVLSSGAENLNIVLVRILDEINDEKIRKELYSYLSRQLSYQLMHLNKDAKFVVWPGTILKGEKMVFVCLYKGKIEKNTRHYYDKAIIYKDIEKPARNLEFPYTRPKSINNDNNLTYKDAVLIEKAIEEHGEGLFGKHSNLEAMIGSSFMLSMSKGYIRHRCVVLYCQVKGIVPYGESAFPKALQVGKVTLPVDVREGFLKQGMFQQNTCIMGRMEWHDKLRMGLSIGVKNVSMAGTLGPFVKLEGKDVGFLTCAHVVGGENVDILQPADGESFLNRSQFERYCGEVTKLFFNPKFREQNNGLINTVGVDAALVQVKGNRKIDARNFPSVPTTDLETAGFNPADPPLFGYGSIRYPLDFRGAQGKRVIKYGRTTGLTKGSLELQGARVRRRDADLELPNKNRVVMTNQYIIEKHGGMPFFLRGDSGAGVFMVGKENKLTLIGLAIGMLDSDYCVVTPIEYVLKALDLRFEDLKFEEDMDVLN